MESTAAPEQTAGATAAKEQTTAKEPAAPVRPQEDPLETNPLELIPQRPPMVLVDRFEGIDAEGVSTTGYTVVPAGLFVAGGRMSECGIIEHMAQSAAARIGWCCRAEGRPVPVGFIGAVSRLELHDLPRTGVHLRTRLRIVQEIGPLSLAEVRTEADLTDEEDLVSEELAEIYLAQGLRAKAIDTYRKLSLLNPEKSVYFAELIGRIETNN